MEQLLWTFEDLRRFTTHPDTPVREWAVERLIKHFPDQAGDVLVTLVDDPRGYVAFKALEFLGWKPPQTLWRRLARRRCR